MASSIIRYAQHWFFPQYWFHFQQRADPPPSSYPSYIQRGGYDQRSDEQDISFLKRKENLWHDNLEGEREREKKYVSDTLRKI